jgi:hypothetical protein
MPHLPPAFSPRPGAIGETLVVAAGERGCRLGIARQDREEVVKTLGVKFEARRKLPQERVQLLLEAQHAGGDEIGERRLDVAKLLQVRDKPAALDGKDKAFRSFVMPSGEGVGVLERIMGADLDRVDLPAGIGELVGMSQPGRIKAPAPAAIGPAGDADANCPRTAHRPSPIGCDTTTRC